MSPAKTFETLRARCALVGVTLLRTDPADGPVRLIAAFEGRLQELRSIEDVEGLVASLATGK